MDDAGQLARQYADDRNLRVRMQAHERYTVGPALEEAVDAALALRGTEALLDVGCGPGDFLARLANSGHRGRLVGVDLSPGMVLQARTRAPQVQFFTADAAGVPLPPAAFDVVTARHMLYHVPDIAAALRECHRLLRPGGRLLALTNASDYMQAFHDLLAAALGADDRFAALTRARPATRFDEHAAEQRLASVYGNVQLAFQESALVFPSPEPVLAYFDTLETMGGIDAAPWREARSLVAQALPGRFAHGPWRVSKRVVLATANKTS
jgi:SAM-dependent methyltransferase